MKSFSLFIVACAVFAQAKNHWSQSDYVEEVCNKGCTQCVARNPDKAGISKSCMAPSTNAPGEVVPSGKHFAATDLTCGVCLDPNMAASFQCRAKHACCKCASYKGQGQIPHQNNAPTPKKAYKNPHSKPSGNWRRHSAKGRKISNKYDKARPSRRYRKMNPYVNKKTKKGIPVPVAAPGAQPVPQAACATGANCAPAKGAMADTDTKNMTGDADSKDAQAMAATIKNMADNADHKNAPAMADTIKNMADNATHMVDTDKNNMTGDTDHNDYSASGDSTESSSDSSDDSSNKVGVYSRRGGSRRRYSNRDGSRRGGSRDGSRRRHSNRDGSRRGNYSHGSRRGSHRDGSRRHSDGSRR